MTNEQTAIMIDGFFEMVGAIRVELNNIPLVIDGNEVEGVDELSTLVRNIENMLILQIDSLRPPNLNAVR